MKKGILAACLLSLTVACPALDWELPVVTLRYETTGGTIESPDPDEDILIPSSLRNTVSLRVKESAEPLDLGLTLRYSAKDYLLQAGDYRYFSLEHDGRIELSPSFDLGYLAGGKWVEAAEDYLAVKGGLDLGIRIMRGTKVDLSLDAQVDLHQTDAESRQVYRASTGFSSRIGQYLLTARYRGEARLPLGAPSAVMPSFLNVGSFSVQWDPNR